MGLIFIVCIPMFKKKKEKRMEAEYQSLIDSQINESEEFKTVVNENNKWDKIAELG